MRWGVVVSGWGNRPQLRTTPFSLYHRPNMYVHMKKGSAREKPCAVFPPPSPPNKCNDQWRPPNFSALPTILVGTVAGSWTKQKHKKTPPFRPLPNGKEVVCRWMGKNTNDNTTFSNDPYMYEMLRFQAFCCIPKSCTNSVQIRCFSNSCGPCIEKKQIPPHSGKRVAGQQRF